MENAVKLTRVTEGDALEHVLRFGRDLDAAMAPRLPAFLRSVSAVGRTAADPYWQGLLSGETGFAVLAWMGERPVGMALVEYGKVAHLESLFVSSEYRNRGVGGALVAYAKKTAAERGSGSMTLHVLDGNDGARRLYEKAGFAGFRTTMAAEL